MRFARALFLTLHVLTLAFGAYVAAAAAVSFIDNVGAGLTPTALSRFAVAAALIVVSLAYAALLLRRGFSLIAPAMFALSYVIVGIVLDATTRAAAKNFAPAAPSDVAAHYALAAVGLAVVCALAFLAWRWTQRRSRYPLI